MLMHGKNIFDPYIMIIMMTRGPVVFDAEPIPSMEQIFAKLAGYKFISKLDLSKGYWQIALSDRSKPYTAFQIPLGLFQFTVLPF